MPKMSVNTCAESESRASDEVKRPTVTCSTKVTNPRPAAIHSLLTCLPLLLVAASAGEIPCPCPCDIEGPFVDASLDTYAYMRNSACLKNYAT